MNDVSYEGNRPVFDFAVLRYTPKVIINTITFLVCGALNTILFKTQTKDFGLTRNSISIQTFIIFIGQYFNLVFFYGRISLSPTKRRNHFRKYKNRALMSGRQNEFSSLKIGFASILNCGASLMQLYALVVLSPSFFQMLLGCGIIFTPLISRVVLKKKIYRHTYIGMVISAVALVLISVASLLVTGMSKTDDELNTLFAICIMIGGVFLGSLQRVYEEWLLDKIETSAFRFVGLEGLFGIICLFVVHILFYTYDRINGCNMFNIGNEFIQVFNSKPLIIISLVLVLSTTFYDLSGIVITRKMSATYRVVNDVAKVVIVWLVEIVLYDIHNDNLTWLTYTLATIIRIVSYSLLILGNILINEITEITICGLDKYFGRYQSAKIDENLLDESEEYSIYVSNKKKEKEDQKQ
jgi:drug/metabolite transporter (DMT)-like permease